MSDRFNQLLTAAGDADKVELKILHNASVQCLKAYNDDPTAARKRDLDAAREGLQDAVDRMWPVYYPGDERFKNLLDVVQYLKGQGYKIGKSKIYQDAGKKQVRVQADGSVLKADADAYSKTLKLLGDPLKGLEAAQAKKAELENQKLEQQIKNLQFDLEIKQTRYVLREEAEMARAGAISVVKVNLINLAHTRVAEWIGICNGNAALAPDLTEAMAADIGDLFHRLAQTDEFMVA